MRKSEKEITRLFEKYSADDCSREEFDHLLDIVEGRESDKLLHRLLKKEWLAGGGRHSVRRASYRWYGAAAVILALITTTIFLWKSPGGEESSQGLPLPEESNMLPGVTRIKLTDGSIVMLRDGSWLDMKHSFAENTREVSLEGEAYFDIVPNPEKPFIIHTGRVKTTVLGTAFSIKANPAEAVVTVTVTRGKVKVEDDKTLLALLEADKQLVYNMKSNRVSETAVDADKVVAWRSHSLIFRNSTFQSIVEELSMIYEVSILFEDEALKGRQITASLDDRDSIETILDVLCTAQRAFYVTEGDSYVIKSLKK